MLEASIAHPETRLTVYTTGATGRSPHHSLDRIEAPIVPFDLLREVVLAVPFPENFHIVLLKSSRLLTKISDAKDIKVCRPNMASCARLLPDMKSTMKGIELDQQT
jgi:hypothetical protein